MLNCIYIVIILATFDPFFEHIDQINGVSKSQTLLVWCKYPTPLLPVHPNMKDIAHLYKISQSFFKYI